MLPFVVFAPWAGWMADRFSKRSSILWLKVAEVTAGGGGCVVDSGIQCAADVLILFLIGAAGGLHWHGEAGDYT
jgi:MFS family permease